MATLKHTTTVPVARTVGECQALLASHGADAVMVRYADRQPVGLSFSLVTPHGARSFTLPVDVAAVHRLLLAQRKAKKIDRDSYTTPEHAARVAWRVLKDWLAAQLAIIEAQMATLDQVMLPYLVTEGETTLYEVYKRREQTALEGGTA